MLSARDLQSVSFRTERVLIHRLLLLAVAQMLQSIVSEVVRSRRSAQAVQKRRVAMRAIVKLAIWY